MSGVTPSEPLDGRAQKVLLAIVGEFIVHGQPVSSGSLTSRYHFGVSSATLRNVMAALTESGFLAQPHTSAGRLPTAKAFRLYVEKLLPLAEAPQDVNDQIRRRIEDQRHADPRDALQSASGLLSSLSSQLGFVVVKDLEDAVFHHIQFVRLGERRILTLFVTRSGVVNTRMLIVDEDVTQDDLDRMTRYLDEKLSGLSLRDVRRLILEEVQRERMLLDQLQTRALRLSEVVISDSGRTQVFISGERNVVDQPDFADLSRIRALFAALEDKHRLVHLLDHATREGRLLVLIGQETRLSEAETLSVVTAPFGPPEERRGALGVVGPIRMDYRSVISIVKATADALSDILGP